MMKVRLMGSSPYALEEGAKRNFLLQLNPASKRRSSNCKTFRDFSYKIKTYGEIETRAKIQAKERLSSVVKENTRNYDKGMSM